MGNSKVLDISRVKFFIIKIKIVAFCAETTEDPKTWRGHNSFMFSISDLLLEIWAMLTRKGSCVSSQFSNARQFKTGVHY